MQPGPDDIVEFVKGSRCRLIELGMAANSRSTMKAGTVLGRGRSANSIRVLFDGFKTPVSLHKKYIELISRSGGSYETTSTDLVRVER